MTEEVQKSESSKLELEKKASKLTDELKASQDNCQQHSSRLLELENSKCLLLLIIFELRHCIYCLIYLISIIYYFMHFLKDCKSE